MRYHYLYFLNKKKEIALGSSYTFGRDPNCDIHLDHDTTSRKHAEIVGDGENFTLKDLNSTNGTFLNGVRLKSPHKIKENDKIRIGSFNIEYIVKEGTMIDSTPMPSDTMIFEKKVADLLDTVKDKMASEKLIDLKNFYNKKKDKMASMAFKDELTRVFNRRYFDKKLKEEFQRSVRYGRPLSLIMVDIDKFKLFNDNYGHQKGDEVLYAVASILQETSRQTDILCRYGGEEMAFILPETDIKNSWFMAEMCRKRVEENAKLIAGTLVTISLGISETSDKINSPELLIKSADEMLYKAKEQGRNRVLKPEGLQ